MLNQEEDTEWNDVLRAKGIIPPRQKEAQITEDQIVSMLENTIEAKTNAKSKKLSESSDLDELEDSEDEEVLEAYRKKRLAEIRSITEKSKFGSVQEISGKDYVDEVTKAGEDIWVVLHLFASGVPLCNLINHFLTDLATRYPQTKFLKSIATTCIPNFPEKNCPSIFIYYEGQMRKQIIGSLELRGDKLTLDEFEYILGKHGAIKTDIKEDPRPMIRDTLFDNLNSVDFD